MLPYTNVPSKMKVQKNLAVRMRCDGGLNLFDAPNEINDNQSTDMLNMWFYNQALRPRPGLVSKTVQKYGKVLDIYPKNGSKILLKRITDGGTVTEEKYGVYVVTQTAILTFDGDAFFRVPNMISYENGAWVDSYIDYDFESCVLVPAGEAEYDSQQSGTEELKAKGSIVYFFGSGHFFAIGPYIMTDGNGHYGAELLINYKVPYVPTLFTDTPPAGGGTENEARNLLGGKEKQLFTTDGTSTLYRLCDSGLDDDTVTVSYDSITGQTSVFIFSSGQTQAVSGSLTATLNRTAGTIAFSLPLIDAAKYSAKSNLAVTYCKTVYSEIPVCNCTMGEWFGDIQSDNGGNRLFLSGNPEDPDRVYYSAPNQATYFPETAYVTAGDPSGPITAFGRHYDILVLFKKDSIYALDFDSSKISVKLIHASCGCDMPGSIQLVDNRLVWANSSAGVFTLLSTQIKNERTVVLISKNINSRLLETDAGALAEAVSVNSGGRYLLFVGNRAYVWDYSLAPFVKGNDVNAAQKKLAWYVWELPQTPYCALKIAEDVYIGGADGTLYQFDAGSAVDSAGWFDAYWYSKFQDFGLDATLKLPFGCRAGYDCADGALFYICYDDGTEELRQTVQADATQPGHPVTAELEVPGLYTRGFRLGIRRLEANGSSFGAVYFDCTAVRGAAAD